MPSASPAAPCSRSAVLVVVQNGRSIGQVVPLYHDFKMALEDKKANFLKKAGLSIVSFFANTFKVRGDNPGKPGEKPVVGRYQLSLPAYGIPAADVLVCAPGGPWSRCS